MNHDLVSYYDKRAKEYEKVSLNPAEQGDLFRSETIFRICCSKAGFGDRLRDGLLGRAQRANCEFSLRDGYQRKRD